MKQIAILRKAIADEQAQINYNLSAEGGWTVDDEEYISAQNHVQDLNSQIVTLRINNQDLYKQMVELPNKIVEDKLTSLKNKYLELTAVLEKGLDSTKAYQNAYVKLASQFDEILGIPSTVAGAFSSNKTFIGGLLSIIYFIFAVLVSLIY